MPPKPGEMQWKRIEDFSPGIHYDTGAAYSTGGSTAGFTGQAAGAVGDYPPGSADPYATYNCIARPTGGLGPLPAMTEKFVWPQTIPYTTTVVAMTNHQLQASGSTTETILGYEYDDGVYHYFSLFALNAGLTNGVEPVTAASETGGNTVTLVVAGTYNIGDYIKVMGTFTGTGWAGISTYSSVYGIGVYQITGTGVGTVTFVYTPAGLSGTPTLTNVSVAQVIASNRLTSNGSIVFGCPYPQYTRMSATNPTTTPGSPTVIIPWAENIPSAWFGSGYIFTYVNPSVPGSYKAGNLVSATPMGQVVCHQNRVISFAYGGYEWANGSYVFNNEQLNFTDPPNSIDYAAQNTFFGVEEPFGYGAAGSISAGELFLVKRRGGGLIVSGDVVNPTVTVLPGVQSTGNMYGRAAQGTMGLVYCSYAQGCWVWNGSNVSSKISPQLDNNFFLVGPAYGLNAGDGSSNYGFFCEAVGDKLYVSNNWVYDTITQSWWTYFPRPGQDPNNTGYNLFWYENLDGNVAYAAPLQFDGAAGGDQTYMLEFQSGQLASYWSWKSNPIKVSENRLVEVREIIARFSLLGTQATTGTPQVTITVFSNGVAVGSVTTEPGQITNTPTDIRLPIGPGVTAGQNAYQTDDLVVQVYAQNTAGYAAPTLHHIDIGYRERQHIPTTSVPV